METKKFIHVTETVRAQLQRELNVSRATAWRALSFSGSSTPTIVRIRARAYELGGILMTVGESAKTLYDHDGYMTQYFPNGAAMQCNLRTSEVVIWNDGEVKERFDNVYMKQIPAIQERARAL